MPSDKHPHGTTFQQSLILALIEANGSLTSGQIADLYAETVKAEVAYNYQYIITRRMADRGLIKAKGGKKAAVFEWALTAKGKKLLKETRRLSEQLRKIK